MYRTLAFGLAAFIAAIAGIFSVWYNTQISPASIDLTRTNDILIVAVIGGLYRIEGAWIGAFIFAVLDNYVRNYTDRFNSVIGLIFLVIVLLSPGGIMGIFGGRPRSASAAAGRQPRRTVLEHEPSTPGPILRLTDVRGGVRRRARACAGRPRRGATASAARCSGRTAPARRRSSTRSPATSPSRAARSSCSNRTSPTCRSGRARRLGMTRTYQISRLFAGLTVLDNLYLATLGVGERRDFSVPRRKKRDTALNDHARSVAERVGLRPRSTSWWARLSHGEQRQLEVGMALAGRPQLLLLDEPAAGLSPAERGSRSPTLLLAGAAEITLIIIEHDMDIALAVAERVTMMHDGR